MTAAKLELADAIGKCKTRKQADKAIDKWVTGNAAFDDLGDAIFEPTVLADLAAQLMLHGRGSRVVQLGPPPGADGATESTSPLPPKVEAFLDQPWQEAIDEFEARGIVKPTELQRLMRDYAQRSDAARKLMLENIQQKVRDELSSAIANGDSFDDFATSLRDNEDSLGITTDDPSYLETVFRTNIQSAYGAGRYRALKSPAVMKARPYVQYRTANDARVRGRPDGLYPNSPDDHWALEGKVFRADSPEADRIAPPNGFNCRCSLLPMSAADVGEGEVSDALPDGFEPDPDFDGPPVASLDV